MIESELHVIGGKHAGQVIPLNRRTLLIGRETDCQLRPSSELVSRHHCVFSIDDYAVRLRDLGSTNGTMVNGERIAKEVTLVTGDRIMVGNLEFEFRVASPSRKSGDETVVSGTETVMEVATTQANEPQPGEPAAAASDQESVEAPAPAPAPDVPADVSATQQLPVMDPPPVSGDTTVINQPMVLPGQTPYQPAMPGAVPGYPGQAYGGYPYQPPAAPAPVYPPGYPQPTPMPGAVPGFVPPPAAPMPAAPVSAPAPAAPAPAADPVSDAGSAPSVSLPDPAETGVKESPPASASSDAEKKPEEEKGSTGEGDSTAAAADIIRQYTQRRPGS